MGKLDDVIMEGGGAFDQITSSVLDQPIFGSNNDNKLADAVNNLSDSIDNLADNLSQNDSGESTLDERVGEAGDSAASEAVSDFASQADQSMANADSQADEESQ